MMTRAVLLFLANVWLATSLFASSSEKVSVVDRQQIVAALAAQGIRVSPSQVELLSEVRAGHDHPSLEIMSVEPWQESSAKIRLRCRYRAECLPFYVLVNSPSPQPGETAMGRWTTPGPRATVSRGSQHEPWMVRNGEIATLIIEGEHLRVQLPVICLANGSAGARIRVSSTDHKRIYLAEVVGSKLLKGEI